MSLVTGVPQTNLPGRYASIDNSAAVQATASTNYKVLLIGTATAGSSGPVDTVVQMFSNSDGEQWGIGGMLDREVSQAVSANSSIPVYAIALTEGAGSKTEQAITFPAGVATANATLHMYVGGQYTPVAIAEADDQDAVATKVGAAVDAKTSLPMTQGSVVANLVTLAAKFNGEAGDSISIQFNRGIKESFPPGIPAPTVVLTAGAGDPSIVPAIAAIVDVQYTHIHLPYTNTTAQDLMKTELDVRFGPEDQQWGVSYTAVNDSTANLITYGNARNSQLQVYPEFDPGTASPLFECMSSLIAIIAGEPDPSAPFQTLSIPGIAGAQAGVGLRRSRSERNTLLSDGIATTVVADDGTVKIERIVTSYQTNPGGSPDVSYKNLNTVLTVLVFRDAINAHFSKFARYKLAGNGNSFGAGQKVMTPDTAKAELITVFEVFENAAILEDVDGFTASLIVERSATDVDRLEYSCNPDTVNQFRILAGVIAFKL